MKMHRAMAATLVWLSAAVAGHAAPVLTASGATGVNVGGSLYDVSFVDGSCATLFTDCGGDRNAGAVDFAFTTEEGATLASSALLTLFNAPGNGAFTADPNSINGCSSVSLCITITPRRFSNGTFEVNVFNNYPSTVDETDDYFFFSELDT